MFDTMKETEVDNTSQDAPKKVRHRKKHLYTSILKQMEFYFGDANLSKDRFLGGLIQIDPYVPISVFLKFNKLRALTDSIEDITKSITKSSILKLSDDETKVCRTTPVQERENVDECTVYVECLPPNADHDWLKNVFLSYGPIAYVSIPRFKHNKKIKGFAFIEFSDELSAQKCMEAFTEMGSKLETQMNPEELKSIATFEDPNNQNAIDDVNVQECSETGADKDTSLGTEADQQISETKCTKVDKSSKKESKRKSKKRSISESEQSNDDSSVEAKRLKKTESDAHTSNEDNEKKSNKRKLRDSPKSEKHVKSVKFNVEDTSGVETEDNENEESAKKRRRKKHTKKYKEDVALIGLKVLSKKEWKKLRNNYLDLQRSKMKQLKKQLNVNRDHRVKNNATRYQQNFYGGNEVVTISETTVDNTTTEDKKPSLEFTSGVIANVKLREPCVDIKDFKALVRNSSEEIKYIDINEGATQAFLRFTDESSATAFSDSINNKMADGSIPQDLSDDYNNQIQSCTLLSGVSENEYWQKMARDREDKRSKKVKQEKRGKDKLIAKAKNSHIHFNGDD